MWDYEVIRVQQLNGVTLVHLLSERLLDHEQVQVLRAELLDLAANCRPQKVVIDFSGVTRCTSELIGALILAWKQIAADGGRVRLCGLNDNIHDVFRITKLEGTVFDIFDTAFDAMREF